MARLELNRNYELALMSTSPTPPNNGGDIFFDLISSNAFAANFQPIHVEKQEEPIDEEAAKLAEIQALEDEKLLDDPKEDLEDKDFGEKIEEKFGEAPKVADEKPLVEPKDEEEDSKYSDQELNQPNLIDPFSLPKSDSKKSAEPKAQASVHYPKGGGEIALTEDELCTGKITCCDTIEPDGSFECYPRQLPNQDAPDQPYYIYTLHIPTMTYSLPTQEPINQNIRWFRETPQDLAVKADGSKAYSLTNDKGVMLTPIDGVLRVNGNHRESYESFEVPGARNITALGQKVAFNLPQSGIRMHDISNDPARFQLASVPEAINYSALKVVNGRIMFGVEVDPRLGTPGSLYNPIELLNQQRAIPIEFSNINEGIEFKKTITFDAEPREDNAVHLIAFEDRNDSMYLKLNLSQEFIEELRNLNLRNLPPLQLPENISTDSIKDIAIYRPNLSGQEHGKALLLDEANKSVLVIDYNYQLGDAPQVSISHVIRFSNKSNPASIALNESKTKAYILDTNLSTLEVLNLNIDTIEAIPTRVNRRIPLAELIPGKDVKLLTGRMSYIAGANPKLMIGSAGLRGALLVNTQSIDQALEGAEVVSAQQYQPNQEVEEKGGNSNGEQLLEISSPAVQKAKQ